MSECKFYIVDVFAERKLEGNQLAVFLCDEPIPDDKMQKIAKEMNFSETTFITSPENFDVRIFTPEAELPFAGHPTLGTAHVIQKELIKENIGTIDLNLKIGKIPVFFEYVNGETDKIWMQQNPAEFYEEFDPALISEILNLKKEDIDDVFPIQEVSTGVAFIIVPLKSLDAVKRTKVNTTKYFELVEKIQAKAILVFCRETYNKENNLNVRVFVDYYGIPEDPATGSGNGCLAGYLVKNRYFSKSSINIRVEQGYEIGRKSLLFLKSEEKDAKIEVKVGGKSHIVAKGNLV
jgi:trans-2,3-dihydro-3-hydroxyanthranilate isomerase